MTIGIGSYVPLKLKYDSTDNPTGNAIGFTEYNSNTVMELEGSISVRSPNFLTFYGTTQIPGDVDEVTYDRDVDRVLIKANQGSYVPDIQWIVDNYVDRVTPVLSPINPLSHPKMMAIATDGTVLSSTVTAETLHNFYTDINEDVTFVTGAASINVPLGGDQFSKFMVFVDGGVESMAFELMIVQHLPTADLQYTMYGRTVIGGLSITVSAVTDAGWTFTAKTSNSNTYNITVHRTV